MRFVAIAILVVACSGPAKPVWRPSPIAGEVLIESDLSARGEVDGTVVVIAKAAVGEATGFGYVRFAHPDLASALRSPHVVVARARASQTLSPWHALAMGASTAEHVYEAAQNGVSTLRYCGADRRQSFLLNARTKRDEGNIVEAGRILQDFLERSLAVCQRRSFERAL